MQPYDRARRAAAHFDEIAPLSGQSQPVAARRGAAGRQAPGQGGRAIRPRCRAMLSGTGPLVASRAWAAEHETAAHDLDLPNDLHHAVTEST